MKTEIRYLVSRVQAAAGDRLPFLCPRKNFSRRPPRFRQNNPMKWTCFFALALAAALCAGCSKTETGATADNSANPSPPSLPTGPQSRLQTMKIYLGPETLDAELALTPIQQQTGLMYRTNITDDTAMLFVLPGPMLPPDGFWMTNCPISLSAAYIGPDGVIEEIHHLQKNDNVPVMANTNNITFVLEVNDGWFARHNIGVGTAINTERGHLGQVFRGGN